jgi:hypothetical protein
MGKVVYEFACTELLTMLVHGKSFNTMEGVDQFLYKETLKVARKHQRILLSTSSLYLKNCWL